jgi:hypothetical protein
MNESRSGVMASQWPFLARLPTVRLTTPSRPPVVSGMGSDGHGRAACPAADASQVVSPAPRRWRLPAATAALLVAREEGAFVELTAGVVT